MHEKEIMNMLRKDARLTMRQAASSLGYSRHAVSKVFRRALRQAGRFTIIPDFRQMGFEIHVLFLLEPRTIRLVKFLKQDLNVNSVFGCRGSYSLMAYAIFRNMRQFADFDDRVSRLCARKRIHFIVEEVKQEDAFI
ncbi:MAG: winged helix-turn-helix domain-containing protein [Nanoarchaeota archaeon]|nr:winged helix-turn-helix domain-containing protein [Nanoarchaeota archaeon]